MNDIAHRLTALKQAWQSIGTMPDDLTMLGLPGKSGRYIEDAIQELACIAAELSAAPSENMVMIRYACESHLKPLEAFFFQDISGHPSMQMLAFATMLQEMQTTLHEGMMQELPHLADKYPRRRF